LGETLRRLTHTAHLRARPSLSLSLAMLITPTTSTPEQDNISLNPLLCFILHQPIWAGTRNDKFTSRLTVLAGPKHRHSYCRSSHTFYFTLAIYCIHCPRTGPVCQSITCCKSNNSRLRLVHITTHAFCFRPVIGYLLCLLSSHSSVCHSI
jgi:hypothetical protein